MTTEHKYLVRHAFNWLVNVKRCTITASEMSSGGRETPDAIGWNASFSYLVEAKISVNDFRIDQKKHFRPQAEIKIGLGMGRHRYYIIPLALKEKILPIMPERWGLLLAYQKDVILAKESDLFETDYDAEQYYPEISS